MFRFDFEDEGAGDSDDSSADIDGGQEKTKFKWAEALEVHVDKEHFNTINGSINVNTFSCGINRIHHIQPNIKNVQDSDVLEAELRHSDLIPGKYEGGFKIWECTQDLANFMIKELSHVFHPGVRVLDLGCGAGILGVLALVHGCTVHFQDYNESVLNSLTIPNVLLNLSKDENDDKIARCRFFAGDWLSFLELTHRQNILYDIILTSETIYNPENYCKLHFVLKQKLKKTGAVYLAAKTCYFGVGGSLRLFENFVSEEGYFTCTHCWSSKEGVQREIVQLRFTTNPE
ncbi:hypothetical protein R5R35_001045 [Gryllus longicercus]|uniref:protein-histidine N-methyltransferase n=1 Tax=Gryllus longicercus TaxID=2509291 RepID=A0AAN9V297_9ORTH